MAEEKKIENMETMSEDELDNVAGGTPGETAEDSKLLYEHGLLNDYHGWWHTSFNWKTDSAEVDAAWAKAGITCVKKPGFKNKYFKDGEKISREEAIAHLRDNFQIPCENYAE